MTRKIFYTADVVTPDGSDTSPDGDATLEGHGATLANGWITPDRPQDVYDTREEVAPDVFDASEYDTDDAQRHPAFWAVSTLTDPDRLYVVEGPQGAGRSVDSGELTVYSGHSAEDLAGVSVSMAAHLSGFTPAEIFEIAHVLDSRTINDPRYRVDLEYTGAFVPAENLAPGQRWVARFEREWIGASETYSGAVALADAALTRLAAASVVPTAGV